MAEAKGLVTHLFLAKFKDGTPPALIENIIKEYANLVNLIKPLKSWHMGKNVSIKNLDGGFTHVFDLTFESFEGLAVFADHPAHTELSKWCRPHLEKFILIDYELTSLQQLN